MRGRPEGPRWSERQRGQALRVISAVNEVRLYMNNVSYRYPDPGKQAQDRYRYRWYSVARGPRWRVSGECVCSPVPAEAQKGRRRSTAWFTLSHCMNKSRPHVMDAQACWPVARRSIFSADTVRISMQHLIEAAHIGHLAVGK